MTEFTNRVDWKTGSIILLPTRNTQLQHERQTLSHSKGLEKDFHANGPKKQSYVAIVISNQTDFRPKLVKGDGNRHFILNQKKNLPRLHFNSEHVCPKCKGTYICKRKNG